MTTHGHALREELTGCKRDVGQRGEGGEGSGKAARRKCYWKGFLRLSAEGLFKAVGRVCAKS